MKDSLRTSGLDAEVATKVSTVVRAVAEDSETMHVPITGSGLVTHLALSIMRAVTEVAPSHYQLPDKFAEKVHNVFQFLITARVWYVFGGKAAIHPREIEYPVLLGPVLESIGRYEDSALGVKILPVPVDKSLMDKSGNPDPTKRLEEHPDYKQVIQILKRFGVSMAYGLPMVKTVEDDAIYRMTVEEGRLVGREAVPPSSIVILSRVLLELKYLVELYGKARVLYCVVDQMQSAIDEIVYRHVRGPRLNFSS